MSNPLISIIIPTYNRAHLIPETLDSIIAQTYTNWECIVVDDGSTDTTAIVLEEYIKKDNRFQYHKRPNSKPKGANACRNYGFEVSNGEYINWFDSDDLMHQDNLKFHVDKLFEDNYDCSISDLYIFVDNVDNIYHSLINSQSNSKDLLIDYITGKVNIGTPSICWKKNVIKDFFFDNKLKRAQELDFYFQVFSSRKINSAFTKRVTVFVRRHNQSISDKYLKNKIEFLESELKVRGEILNYMINENLSFEIIDKGLFYYFVAYKKYINGSNIYKALIEFNRIKISKLFKKTNFYRWYTQFFLLIVVYKISAREYQLKQMFLNLKSSTL